MVLVLDINLLARRGPVAKEADARRMQPDGGQLVGPGYGSGRSSRASTTLKIALLAPMPMANESSMTMVSPAFLRSMRSA